MTGLLRDLYFGLRALKRAPAFVVLAVLCLGIGIGASAMTFTAVNDVLLKPLGSIDPKGLVAIGEVRQSAPGEWLPASWANFLDWKTSTAGFARMSALRASRFDVGTSGFETGIEGVYTTENIFAVLGVAPVLGRGLQPGDDDAGAEPVVVLSETFWRRRFGSDRTIVGRELRIDGVPRTVVGVVPALLDVGMEPIIRAARVWVPLGADSGRSSRDDRSLFVVARLGEGVSVESFSARLETIVNDLAEIHPEDAGWSVGVGPLAGSGLGRVRPLLLLSLGAAALVFLIACANVASITLARAMRRRREFGIHAAIGASPWRIARQLLGESFVVAALGAALGLSLARLGLDFIVRLYTEDTLAPAALPIDTRSLTFSVVLAVLTTILFGLYPALEAARGAARVQIAESGFGTTTARGLHGLRRGFVAGQVAGSLVVLIGAALLARSFMNLLAVDGGVETRSVTSIRVDPLDAPSGPEDAARYTDRMLDALSGVAGVEVAAAGMPVLPLRGAGFRSAAGIPGSTPSQDAGPVVAYAGVTPRFFDALEIPVLSGRVFTENEGRGNVAVVNESLANLFWPGQDALGRQFRLDTEPERGWITVIGVSRDYLTWDSNFDEPVPTAYLDAASFDVYPIFFFIRRHNADEIVSTGSIMRAIEPLGFPARRIFVTPMEEVARAPFWRQRVFSLWFTTFGIAALMLTAVGIYGVLAYLVGQRWREIGIRMALGADRRKVLLMVLRQGVRFVGTGIAIGLAGAYILARAMRDLLFGVAPIDSVLFMGVTVFLATVAMAASLAPALRAARVDPNVLLRD